KISGHCKNIFLIILSLILTIINSFSNLLWQFKKNEDLEVINNFSIEGLLRRCGISLIFQ
ncbi:MAG: hypothetical protein M1308_14855, partial [Actinobacteria bacterium]|nr:hypothetical protein [Actinomycetota bacterium]